MSKIELNISPTQVKTIEQILNRGNQVEIKKEKDKIVIVEIKRSVQSKEALING